MKKKIFRRLALLVSLLMLVTSTVNTTYGIIVTKTPSLVNIFTPFDSAMSDLVIRKNIEHPFGMDYVVPDNENTVFDFKVELGALYANTKIKTENGTITADATGAITVAIRGNNSVGIVGIDAGTRVTVSELTDRAGFTVSGDAVQTVTIADNERAELTFTNIYEPAGTDGATVDVVGVKKLEGRDWQDGDTFTVVLEQHVDGAWKRLGAQTINENNKTFDLSAWLDRVAFAQAGEYKFRVRELAGDLADIDYDEEPKVFTVCVTDADMDGVLEVGAVRAQDGVTVTTTNGRFAVDVLLSNVYVEPVDVAVTVNKTVTAVNGNAIAPEGFEFVLENAETQEQIGAMTDKNGHATMNLHYGLEDAGQTFTYTLSEIRGDVSGVTYDEKVYRIEVTVARVEDAMTAKVAVDGVVVEECMLRFENRYDEAKAVTPPTGDAMNLPFWLTMMVISGTACIVLALLDRRDRARR